MRTDAEIRDLVDSLEQNVDKLSFEEVNIAADELERQLQLKREDLKASRVKAMKVSNKKEPKKKAKKGVGSY